MKKLLVRSPHNYTPSRCTSECLRAISGVEPDLVAKYRANEVYYSTFGYEPIHMVAALGTAACLDRILSLHTDVVNKTTAFGMTPLHYAAQYGNISTLELLIAKEAMIEALTTYGNTPLMYAVRFGSADCVKLLLESGASWYRANAGNATPLDTAFERWYCMTPLIAWSLPVNWGICSHARFPRAVRNLIQLSCLAFRKKGNLMAAAERARRPAPRIAEEHETTSDSDSETPDLPVTGDKLLCLAIGVNADAVFVKGTPSVHFEARNHFGGCFEFIDFMVPHLSYMRARNPRPKPRPLPPDGQCHVGSFHAYAPRGVPVTAARVPTSSRPGSPTGESRIISPREEPIPPKKKDHCAPRRLSISGFGSSADAAEGDLPESLSLTTDDGSVLAFESLMSSVSSNNLTMDMVSLSRGRSSVPSSSGVTGTLNSGADDNDASEPVAAALGGGSAEEEPQFAPSTSPCQHDPKEDCIQCRLPSDCRACEQDLQQHSMMSDASRSSQSSAFSPILPPRIRSTSNPVVVTSSYLQAAQTQSSELRSSASPTYSNLAVSRDLAHRRGAHPPLMDGLNSEDLLSLVSPTLAVTPIRTASCPHRGTNNIFSSSFRRIQVQRHRAHVAGTRPDPTANLSPNVVPAVSRPDKVSPVGVGADISPSPIPSDGLPRDPLSWPLPSADTLSPSRQIRTSASASGVLSPSEVPGMRVGPSNQAAARTAGLGRQHECQTSEHQFNKVLLNRAAATFDVSKATTSSFMSTSFTVRSPNARVGPQRKLQRPDAPTLASRPSGFMSSIIGAFSSSTKTTTSSNHPRHMSHNIERQSSMQHCGDHQVAYSDPLPMSKPDTSQDYRQAGPRAEK